MYQTFQKYFVPNSENNYQPRFLRAKRTVWYGALFLVIKCIAIICVILLPAEAFVVPDILTGEANKIISLTNDVRVQKGLAPYVAVSPLFISSNLKAQDMSANNYFSHVSPDNHTLSYFLKKAGYKYTTAGENLAMGFSDAESVVNAWLKSPSHYANLVDNDFTDFGVSLETGYYNGQPTVYVAQHFGSPMASTTYQTASPIVSALHKTAPVKIASASLVRGEKISSVASTSISSIVYDSAKSRVYWLPVNNGQATAIQVRAALEGSIKEVIAYVNGYQIELWPGEQGLYKGSFTINQTPESLFEPVITPTMIVRDLSGNSLSFSIDWDTVNMTGLSPVEKYLQAKKHLAPFLGFFVFSKFIYWGFLIIFSLAFLINLLVEVKKQHYHTIIQTLFIIALLVWLLRV